MQFQSLLGVGEKKSSVSLSIKKMLKPHRSFFSSSESCSFSHLDCQIGIYLFSFIPPPHPVVVVHFLFTHREAKVCCPVSGKKNHPPPFSPLAGP